ncbi:hypothetical protein ACIQTT_05760 [Microbacterium sp. NPDC090225]|uniref:hypothetical protein n=1 Tax=Microbacterium sp. NPDC090225 TaxID=3364207 RepID=UPI00380EDBEE
MPHARSFTNLIFGLVTVGALLGLSACAPEPDPTPDPTPTAAPETPEPAAYDGPLHFVGDELDWFLPSEEEIRALLPGIAEMSEPSSALEQISDGGGPVPVPSICGALSAEMSLGSVGARTLTWTLEGSDNAVGRLHVLQLADEAQVAARMDQLRAAAEQCGSYVLERDSGFDAEIVGESDGAQAIAGTLTEGFIDGEWRYHKGYASMGNVIVELFQTGVDGSTIDAAAVAEMLREHSRSARDALIGELTANPPTPSETPTAADPSAPWSAWEMSTAAVGPIVLGSDLDAALAAVPGARAVEPEWSGSPWWLTAADGSASVGIWTDESGERVESVTVGVSNVYGEPVHPGGSLPSAGGVRVGDPVSAAITAFPQGTFVTVVASGEYFYESATRDGGFVRFRSDRDPADPAAVVTGIGVEDATLRAPLVFG